MRLYKFIRTIVNPFDNNNMMMMIIIVYFYLEIIGVRGERVLVAVGNYSVSD